MLAVVDYGQTPVGSYREALVAIATGPWSARVPWIAVDDPASAAAGRAWWNLPKQIADIAVHEQRVSVRAPDAEFELTAARLWPVVWFAVPGLLRQPQRGPALVVFIGRIQIALMTAAGTLPAGVRPGRRLGLLLSGRLRVGAPRGGDAGRGTGRVSLHRTPSGDPGGSPADSRPSRPRKHPPP